MEFTKKGTGPVMIWKLLWDAMFNYLGFTYVVQWWVSVNSGIGINSYFWPQLYKRANITTGNNNRVHFGFYTP